MPASPHGEIEALIRQGRQMDAITMLRRTEGFDIRQAVEEIERIETGLAGVAADSDPRAAHGCRPSQRVLGEVKTQVLQAQRMEAIKLLHEGNGMGLVEANQLSEDLSRQERRSHLFRAFLVWLLIAAAETVHGILRSLFMVPAMGDLRARQIGVLSGSLIILTIVCSSITWIGARGTRQLLKVGLMWVVLMASFEIVVGWLLGLPWQRIAAEINPWQGGFLLVGMAVLAMSPFIAAATRSRALLA